MDTEQVTSITFPSTDWETMFNLSDTLEFSSAIAIQLSNLGAIITIENVENPFTKATIQLPKTMDMKTAVLITASLRHLSENPIHGPVDYYGEEKGYIVLKVCWKRGSK